jgi:acetyl-CoA carboxylase alpha subunit
MATAQQLLQAMQQMQQQQQQFQQQLMQQLVQQLGQLHERLVAAAPAQVPVLQQYNWVRMPEKFSYGDLVEFLDDYVRCSTANGWTDQNRIDRLGPYLAGQALILFNTLRDDQKQTWPDTRANLLAL